MYENVQRFASTMADEPHKHSVWYLLGMLMLGVLPWTIPMLRLLSFRAFWKNRWFETIRGLPPLTQFSLLVTVSVVFFFCIPSSKRSIYLLPAYPFIAVLIEQMIRRHEDATRGILGALTRVVYVALLPLGIVALLMYYTPIFGVSLDSRALLQSFTPLKSFSLLAILGCLALPLRKPFRAVRSTPAGQLAVSIVSAVVLVSCFVYDTIAWQLSPKRWVFSESFNAAVIPQAQERCYSFGAEAYGASFYLHKPFSRITPQNAHNGVVVFLEARKRDEFARTITPNMQELYRYSSGVEDPKKDIIVVRLQGIASTGELSLTTSDSSAGGSLR
jgi:4-amino-4-deoxy-L-arabinose transferase-like glycosyltransferase